MYESSDNHSHILYDDIRSMVLSAKSKKLDSISITEHISQFKEVRKEIDFGSTHRTGRMFSDIEEYLLDFETLGDENLVVKRGLEVDYIQGKENSLKRFVSKAKWDILLCSIHEFADKSDIEKSGAEKESSQKRWMEYMDLQRNALESKFIPFDVLSHPTRIAKSAPPPPDDIDKMLLELAMTAKKEDKALELNGKDIVRGYLLVEKLARACSKAGCKVSFGSDAHHPSEVGRGYQKALELTQSLGL